MPSRRKPAWVSRFARPGVRSLAAVACGMGLAACVGTDTGGPGPAGDGPTPGDSSRGDDFAPQPACKGTAAYIRVATAQSLAPIIEAPERCLLYGVDRTGTAIYFIDTRADVLRLTAAVGNQPSDLTLSTDGAHLYVSVLGDSKIVDLDAETGEVIGEVSTQKPPFRIARGIGRMVYYVEEDIFSAVYEVDMRNKVERRAKGVDFHEPDLEATADGTKLFLGEANQPGSELFAFDTTEPDLPEVDRFHFDGGFGLPSPKRRIFLAEAAGRVYFADRSFDAADLSRVRGWLGSQAVAGSSDGRIVATDESLFDAVTFVRFATRLHPNGGALFSGDGQWLYEFDAVGSLLYRTSVERLVGVHQLGQTLVPAGSLAQHDFTMLLADPNPARPFIYALDTQQNQLVFIDRNTQLPVRAEIIGSSPTDMALHPNGDALVIATFGATEVAVIDLTNTTKALKNSITVPGNPFRIAVGPNDKAVYVEQDQFSDMTLLDVETEAVGPTVTGTVYQPDVEFGPNGDFLYVGEAAGDNAHLYKVDMRVTPFDFQSALVSADAYSFPTRQVIYNNGYVYYAGNQFDADTLAARGGFGDDIILISPDGRLAFSQTRIYGTACRCEMGGLPESSPLIAVDPNSETLYQFDNSTGALFVQPLP